MSTKYIEITILEYINKYGLGEPVSPLNNSLSAPTFRQHYYKKNELISFCRGVGIPTTGMKEDLNQRIELYLSTGQVDKLQK